LEQFLGTRGSSRDAWVYRAAEALGRLYLSEGDREAAIMNLELAVTGLKDDPDLLNTLGFLYADENSQLDRAAALVRGALAVAPPDTPEPVLGYYRDSLGWAMFRQGKLDSALTELEIANRLAPNTPEIRDHLVETYDALGRRDAAEAILVEDLVTARGVDPERRARLRRLYRTTPQGRPTSAEFEVERQVIARAAAEIAAIEAEGGRVIRIESRDGFPLVATLYPAAGGKANASGGKSNASKSKASKSNALEAKPAPAVLLVPMLAGQRSDYQRLARDLAQSGISALCLDLRGHGASVTDELPNPRAFQEEIPQHVHGALLDLEAALRYLRTVVAGGKPLAVVGASFGGFLAALGTAEDETVAAIVLLSPGPADAYTEAVTRRRERPTLLVAGGDDLAGLAGARAMLEHLDRSRSELVTYPNAGYGTDMLEQVPELIPLIVRWLGGAFKGARGL
jgi:dienelactone hydrolase